MFIAALFITAPKQPKCSSAKEWINKLRYSRTRKYYPEIEKNELMSRIGKCIETESKLVVARCWREEGVRSDHLVGTGFPFGLMKMPFN